MLKSRRFNTFLDEAQYHWLGREARLRNLQPSAYLRQLIDEKRGVYTGTNVKKPETKSKDVPG